MTQKRSRTQVQTETQLTPLEEKVVRMRHGLRAPATLRLERVGQDNADTAAQIAEIERRALARAGTRDTPTKRKILRALKRR